jgi:hypothetical protein
MHLPLPECRCIPRAPILSTSGLEIPTAAGSAMQIHVSPSPPNGLLDRPRARIFWLETPPYFCRPDFEDADPLASSHHRDKGFNMVRQLSSGGRGSRQREAPLFREIDNFSFFQVILQ